jgi:ribonuclease HII
MSYVVGIDEAGRGPLAGPVAVGVVIVPLGFNPPSPGGFGRAGKNFFKGIKDSKKLTAEERELWYQLAIEARKKGALDFSVSLVSEKVIDRKGIVFAVKLGIKRCFEKLKIVDTEETQVFLDGSLQAPEKFKHQRTVIKGDEKIPVISLASIVAKVVRDKTMVKLSKKFPGFNFHIHKGYGTLSHRLALRKYGSTELHRQSFLKNFAVHKAGLT